jgi:hypothetical protein
VYQNAENMGKSGVLCCLLGCILPCIPSFLLRGEARERWGIEVRPIMNMSLMSGIQKANLGGGIHIEIRLQYIEKGPTGIY